MWIYFVDPEHMHGSIRGFSLETAVDKQTRHCLVCSFGFSWEAIDISSLIGLFNFKYYSCSSSSTSNWIFLTTNFTRPNLMTSPTSSVRPPFLFLFCIDLVTIQILGPFTIGLPNSSLFVAVFIFCMESRWSSTLMV